MSFHFIPRAISITKKPSPYSGRGLFVFRWRALLQADLLGGFAQLGFAFRNADGQNAIGVLPFDGFGVSGFGQVEKSYV